jgi:peptide deformylase
LRVISKPVETFDAELKTLIADMFETMYDAPGIGLAAIQVGVPKRILVIDLQEARSRGRRGQGADPHAARVHQSRLFGRERRA